MIGFEFSGLDSLAGLANLGERSLTIAGHEIQGQIRRFSQQLSMTPDGATFKPYVPAYAKYRQRKGRQTSPVNLTFTGEYMRDIMPRKVGNEVQVGPKESDMLRAQGLSAKREHIGIAPETPGIIEAKMLEEFERAFA